MTWEHKKEVLEAWAQAMLSEDAYVFLFREGEDYNMAELRANGKAWCRSSDYATTKDGAMNLLLKELCDTHRVLNTMLVSNAKLSKVPSSFEQMELELIITGSTIDGRSLA